MGIFCIGLHTAGPSYAASVVMLSLLGLSSRLFIVPLNAYLQQRSGSHEKGRIIATNNFYNTVGLLLASATLWSLHDTESGERARCRQGRLRGTIRPHFDRLNQSGH
jgi:hypothetical protein